MARFAWRHLPQLLAGVAAAIPVIESTAKAVRAGWVPAGDDGIIATRGWDVLTGHTPLVGQYSEAGLVVKGQVMHSPGPMLYWLIALPARFGSVTSIAVTIGSVNALAIVGCVALARRRGGLVLMFATAAGIALMCRSLPGEAMHDIWNPAAGLFPFLLLIFLCWSLACGEHRLLPASALVASYVTQTHLMYAAPTAVLLAVGCFGLVAVRTARLRRGLARDRAAPGPTDAARDRDRDRAPAVTAAPDGQALAAPEPRRVWPWARAAPGPRRVWPWALAALLVAAACWTPPAIDQIENQPGNLTMVVRTAEHRGATLGAKVGWHAVELSVGVQPWWLQVPASEWQRKTEVRATPSTTREESTIAILAALAFAGLAGALARRWDLAAAAAIGLGLCAAIGLEAASNPASRLLSETLGYTMWWGSELGLWVWLVLAWALWLGLVGVARSIARVARALLARRRSAASSGSPMPALGGSPALAPDGSRVPAASGSPALALGGSPALAPDGSRVPAASGSPALALGGSRVPAASGSPTSPRKRPPAFAGPVALMLASLVCVGAVTEVGRAAARTEKPDSHVYEYASIRRLAAAIEHAIPPGQTIEYRFGPLDTGTQPMEPAIRYLLVRHGDRVLARGSYTRLGSYYEYYGQPVDWVLDVRDGTANPQLAGAPRGAGAGGAGADGARTAGTGTAGTGARGAGTRGAGALGAGGGHGHRVRPVAAGRRLPTRLVASVRFRSPWGKEVVEAWVAKEAPRPARESRRL